MPERKRLAQCPRPICTPLVRPYAPRSDHSARCGVVPGVTGPPHAGPGAHARRRAGQRGARYSAAPDRVRELIRWSAFGCVLAPGTLLTCGASTGSATGAALGLAAITGVCWALLRRSERGPARPLARGSWPPPGHHALTSTGTPRRGRRRRA